MTSNSNPPNENSFDQEAKQQNQRAVIYALVWKAHEIGPQTMQAFEERIPRLMSWLKTLKKDGNLVACGGGAFESSEGYSGGLTLVRATSFEHARTLSNGTPMNEIGKTEVMIWDVFHADLQENTGWQSNQI
jgi:uncharacterized protein YciI